jgi:hypothetical protein
MPYRGARISTRLPRLTAELHIPSIMAIQRSKTVALFAALIGASLCAALLVYGAPKLREFRGGLTEQKRELAGEPESVSDGAVQQRFQARRAAVAAMQADLRKLISAEELYFADSVKYTSNLGMKYSTSRGVVGPTITLTTNGWWAYVSNNLTAITCAVASGGDTTFGSAKSGKPVCFGRRDWWGQPQY